MPAYLCHGFRWYRKSIRYFVILQDVDDGAPEWIVAPRSAEAILGTLYELFDFIPPSAAPPRRDPPLAGNYSPPSSPPNYATTPGDGGRQNYDDGYYSVRGNSASGDGGAGMPGEPAARPPKSARRPVATPITPPLLPSPTSLDFDKDRVEFNDWSAVKFLEEYDPSNEFVLNGPWAYVADYVVQIDGSVSPIEEMMRYEERMKMEKAKAMSGPSDETGREANTTGNQNAGWLEKLRDQLQRGEGIRWYVVVCGDTERNFSPGTSFEEGESADDLSDTDDVFEPRLPEFADLDTRSLEVQPLRLRPKPQAQLKPPPRNQQSIPPQIQPPSPVQGPPPSSPPQTQLPVPPPRGQPQSPSKTKLQAPPPRSQPPQPPPPRIQLESPPKILLNTPPQVKLDKLPQIQKLDMPPQIQLKLPPQIQLETLPPSQVKPSRQSQLQTPPRSQARVSPQFQPQSPPRNRVESIPQSQLQATRTQVQNPRPQQQSPEKATPQLQQPRLSQQYTKPEQKPRTQPSVEGPPAVPAKDFRSFPPPPNPLQNLQEVGKMSIESSTRPKRMKSSGGLRKLFSRKQIENTT